MSVILQTSPRVGQASFGGSLDHTTNATHDAPDAAAQRWLLSGDLPCPGCNYNLRGLVGPVVHCPECGHDNDLRDPSPWRRDALPLGVVQREHWPATTVMWSMAVVTSVLVAGVAWREGSLIVVLVVPVVIGGWLWEAWRWVRQCHDWRWALGVLGLVHAWAWLLLVGLGAPMASSFRWPWVLAGLAVPVAIAGFVLSRRFIQQAEDRGHYRVDWRRWRLPTQGRAHGTGNGPAKPAPQTTPRDGEG